MRKVHSHTCTLCAPPWLSCARYTHTPAHCVLRASMALMRKVHSHTCTLCAPPWLSCARYTHTPARCVLRASMALMRKVHSHTCTLGAPRLHGSHAQGTLTHLHTVCSAPPWLSCARYTYTPAHCVLRAAPTPAQSRPRRCNI
eukprot:1177153-Prorocentrum_minimum.AAC.1